MFIEHTISVGYTTMFIEDTVKPAGKWYKRCDQLTLSRLMYAMTCFSGYYIDYSQYEQSLHR